MSFYIVCESLDRLEILSGSAGHVDAEQLVDAGDDLDRVDRVKADVLAEQLRVKLKLVLGDSEGVYKYLFDFLCDFDVHN